MDVTILTHYSEKANVKLYTAILVMCGLKHFTKYIKTNLIIGNCVANGWTRHGGCSGVLDLTSTKYKETYILCTHH